MRFILSNHIIHWYLNPDTKDDKRYSLVPFKDFSYVIDEISRTNVIIKQLGIYETVYYVDSLDNKIGCMLND